MSRKKLKIGIVGCGAIGSTLALSLHQKFKAFFDVVAVSDINSTKAAVLAGKIRCVQVVALKELIRCCDIIVEAASARASYDIARQALRARKSVLVMSIGGILGREKGLFALAEKNSTKIYFPSGAIAGLDAISALTLAGIRKITLKTYKPPAALEGAPYILRKNISLRNIKKEIRIFSGKAASAVQGFPQNINVVALLSLAARGQAAPQVQIFASPALQRNVHVIEVESSAARLVIRCENVPSPDNPKTSYLAILSALRTLIGISDAVKIAAS